MTCRCLQGVSGRQAVREAGGQQHTLLWRLLSPCDESCLPVCLPACPPACLSACLSVPRFPRHVLEFMVGSAAPGANLSSLAHIHDQVTILFMVRGQQRLCTSQGGWQGLLNSERMAGTAYLQGHDRDCWQQCACTVQVFMCPICVVIHLWSAGCLMLLRPMPHTWPSPRCLPIQDIVSFTSMSKEVAPHLVMQFLNELFSKFDHLCDVHAVYKVRYEGVLF